MNEVKAASELERAAANLAAPKTPGHLGAHVVLAGPDPARLDRLGEGLARNGFLVGIVPAGPKLAAQLRAERPDILVLEGGRSDGWDRRLVAELRSHPETAHIAIVSVAADGPEFAAYGAGPEIFDDVLARPVPAEVLAARLSPLVRLSTMAAECRRRIDTRERLHIAGPGLHMPAVAAGTRRILAVGADSALAQALGVGTVGAPSLIHQGGFDLGSLEALFGGQYDALVLGRTAETDLAVIERIRAHAAFYDFPIVVLDGKDVDAGHRELYRAGASVTLPSAAAALEVRFALQALERRKQQRAAMRSALRDTLAVMPKDPLTGLPDGAFLDAHAPALAAAARSRPLVGALFTLDTLRHTAYALGPHAAHALMRQVSAWIAGLVRAEDTVARAHEGEVLMLLPGTTPEAAEHVARRIAAILRHTEMGLPGVEGPVRPWLRTGVASFRDVESWNHIAERARTTLH